MHRALLRVALLGCVLGNVATVAGADCRGSTIDDDVWATYRKLSWDDFRKERRGGWRGEAAWIYSMVQVEDAELVVERNGDSYLARPEGLEIYALMNKLESGYQRGDRTDWSLAHEQGHFDITEVSARRLRRQLCQLEARAREPEDARAKLEAELSARYQEGMTEWRSLQEQYDGETGHGTVKKRQKKWWETIAGWLATVPE